jgi:hypothetical protein
MTTLTQSEQHALAPFRWLGGVAGVPLDMQWPLVFHVECAVEELKRPLAPVSVAER